MHKIDLQAMQSFLNYGMQTSLKLRNSKHINNLIHSPNSFYASWMNVVTRSYIVINKSKREAFYLKRSYYTHLNQYHSYILHPTNSNSTERSGIGLNSSSINNWSKRNYAITVKREKVIKKLKDRFEAFKKTKVAESKKTFAENEDEKILLKQMESDVIHIDQEDASIFKQKKKNILSSLTLDTKEATIDPSVFDSTNLNETEVSNNSNISNSNQSISEQDDLDESLELLLKQRIKDHQVPASRKEARKLKKEALSSTSLKRSELFHLKQDKKIFAKKTVPVLKTDSNLWKKSNNYKPTYISPAKAKFSEIFEDMNNVVHQPEQPKILKVSIIGNPNAGKSTFLNAVVGEKVSAVSHKVCTTRNNILGIYTEGNTQVLFFDTPGILQKEDKKLYKKNEDIMGEAFASLYDADMAVLFIDATKDLTHINHLLSALESFYLKYRFKSQDSILPRGIIAVLNKIDLITPKNRVGDIVHELQKSSLFSRVFPLSAKQGEGLTTFKLFLLSKAKSGNWLFNKDKKTDLTKEERLLEIVREKIFLHVHNELPYDCKIEIPKPISFFDHKRSKESSASVGVLIQCPTAAAVRIVVGQLKPLHAKAVRELEEILKRKVYITFNVKLDKDMR